MRHDDGAGSIRLTREPPPPPVQPGDSVKISADHPRVRFVAFVVSQASAGWRIDQIQTGGVDRLAAPRPAQEFVPPQEFAFLRSTAFTILALVAHDVAPSEFDLGDGAQSAIVATNTTGFPAYFDAGFVVEVDLSCGESSRRDAAPDCEGRA